MSTNKQLFKDLFNLYKDCNNYNWDGYNSNPVTIIILNNTISFINQLPKEFYKHIELSVNPIDGCIIIEFFNTLKNIISIDINENNNIQVVAILEEFKFITKNIKYEDYKNIIDKIIKKINGE